MPRPTVDSLAAAALLSPLDTNFARTVGRIGGENDADVLLAAALASRQVGHGNVCLDLRRLAAEPLTDDTGQVIQIAWPDVGAWMAALRASDLVAEEGSGDELQHPLVLDGEGRLYLQRYWSHQRRLADAIRSRVDADLGPVAWDLRTAITDGQPDWQRIAALVALERRFCVISGGPGTGKTHTVVKILALLVQQALAGVGRPPLIQLVAPTGKAAARLTESIQAQKGSLDVGEDVRAAIPEEASTIHRCLGVRPGSSTRFRHDRDNPLAAAVVLVDEASMVDVALMARLADALAPDARLILLGDKDQLASVEAGAVLGDICNTGGVRLHSQAFAAHVREKTGDEIPVAADAPAATGIWDCVVNLTHSYRYDEASGIGALARAINAGEAAQALAVLASSDEVELVESESERPALLALAAEGFGRYLAAPTPAAQLACLNDFRVLCAHRRGPHGAETINREIEAELSRRGLLDLASGNSYLKRPILITRNDYQLALFNGDVGVVGPAGDEGQRAAFFAAEAVDPTARRRADGPPDTRGLALSRLPPHETVFAMSVHKSQGSEFGSIAIVLPPEITPVLSRELLYTAVSRARRRVTIFAGRDVLRAAIERRIERASGLRDLLWKAVGRGFHFPPTRPEDA